MKQVEETCPNIKNKIAIINISQHILVLYFKYERPDFFPVMYVFSRYNSGECYPLKSLGHAVSLFTTSYVSVFDT